MNCSEEIENYVSEANKFASEDNYVEALAKLNTAEDIFGKDSIKSPLKKDVNNVYRVDWSEDYDSTTISYRMPDGYDKISGYLYVSYNRRQ